MKLLKSCFIIVCLMVGIVVNSFTVNVIVYTHAVQNTGTDFFEITTAQQLYSIGLEENLNKNFILKNDIDLAKDLSWKETLPDSENGFLPINAINNFGTFDGNGYTIKGLHINRPNLNKVGLFSDSSLTIQNLKVEYSKELPSSLIGGDLTGGLVANNLGTISHCSVKADIKSSNVVGGLVGINEGNIYNCFFEGTVQGKIVGGLIGRCISGNISDCYSSGAIYSKIAGGFIGESFFATQILNSFSFTDIFDNIDENGLNFFGSFIGKRDTDVVVNNCYALTDIAIVNQGSIDGIMPLESIDFLQQNKFNLDFENTWYCDGIAEHPLIRNIYVKLSIENSFLSADELLKKNYYYKGEIFQISLLNYPDKEFASIKVNGQNKEDSVINKKLECSVEGRTQINIQLEYLLQIKTNQKNAGDIVLEKEFYKNGEKIVIEVKNKPLCQIKEVYGNISDEKMIFQSIGNNKYEFLIDKNIEESASLIISVDYFNCLPIVIGASVFLTAAGIILILILIWRKKNGKKNS